MDSDDPSLSPSVHAPVRRRHSHTSTGNPDIGPRTAAIRDLAAKPLACDAAAPAADDVPLVAHSSAGGGGGAARAEALARVV